MDVCMCVCEHMCVSLIVYVWACACERMSVSVYVWMCMCERKRVCERVYEFERVCVMCESMCVWIHDMHSSSYLVKMGEGNGNKQGFGG